VYSGRLKWIGFVVAVYLLFNALSYMLLPDYLVITPRNQFVFEHIIGVHWVAAVYLLVALWFMIAFSFNRWLWPAFIITGLINIFWGIIAVIPALLGVIPTGNATGASLLFAFSAIMFISSFSSYRAFNWFPKDLLDNQ